MADPFADDVEKTKEVSEILGALHGGGGENDNNNGDSGKISPMLLGDGITPSRA